MTRSFGARSSHVRRGRACTSSPRREGLAALVSALRSARTAEDVMSVLVLEAQQTFGATSAVAYLVCGATLEFAAAMGRAEDAHEWLHSVPREAQIPVARAVREGRPCWFECNAALAAAFPGWVERVPHAERFGALAALPLRHGGLTFGAVGFAFDAERAFPPDERADLEVATAEGARALERIGLPDSERAADGQSAGSP